MKRKGLVQIKNSKKIKGRYRQVIVVANKALRFKTTKLEYKRTIQYADAKKIDAIKKKKKVKQVTQYYKKDSTYKIKSPYVLKKSYQLKGFSLRKSKKGKVYKDKGKLTLGMWKQQLTVSDCRKKEEKEERMIKMKKIVFLMTLIFMAPVLFLQSKAQAAEISLTAENFPDAVVLKVARKRIKMEMVSCLRMK